MLVSGEAGAQSDRGQVSVAGADSPGRHRACRSWWNRRRRSCCHRSDQLRWSWPAPTLGRTSCLGDMPAWFPARPHQWHTWAWQRAREDSSDLRCERDWHISNLFLLPWTLMGVLPLRSIKSKLGWWPGFDIHWHTLLLFLALLPSSACCSWLALPSVYVWGCCAPTSQSHWDMCDMAMDCMK